MHIGALVLTHQKSLSWASKYYDAGHMMYLRDEDLAKLKGNIAALIDSASKQ